jgi:hypothetical protein
LDCSEDWIQELKDWEGAGNNDEGNDEQDGMEAEYETPELTPKTLYQEWRPGLTEKGERILAMAPTGTTNILGNRIITRCLIPVEENERQNPLAFEDTADIGEKAARGYLKLPEAKRIDIRSKKKLLPEGSKRACSD